MDIQLDVKSADISANNTRNISVSLSGVDTDQLIDQIPIDKLISYWGISEFLDKIGIDECVSHFGLDKDE